MHDQPALTARVLFDELHKQADLTWISGRANQAIIARDEFGNPLPLVSYLNLIHPSQVQVIGPAERAYLQKLAPDQLSMTMQQMFPTHSGIILLTDSIELPELLANAFLKSDIPLISSSQAAYELIELLQDYLTSALGERITVHGVMMEVLGVGVLITGASGIGKSELALELLTRGHRLIGDDCPEFQRGGPSGLNGMCPPAVQDFLEVRGLGILNIRAMFGAGAIKTKKPLRLIIHLEETSKLDMQSIDRLTGARKTRRILGVDMLEITLPVTAGRNLAVLVETAVRDQLLRLYGYTADDDLIQHQAQYIR